MGSLANRAVLLPGGGTGRTNIGLRSGGHVCRQGEEACLVGRHRILRLGAPGRVYSEAVSQGLQRLLRLTRARLDDRNRAITCHGARWLDVLRWVQKRRDWGRGGVWFAGRERRLGVGALTDTGAFVVDVEVLIRDDFLVGALLAAGGRPWY